MRSRRPKWPCRALEAKKDELEHSRRSASLFQGTLRGEPQEAPRTDVSYGRIRVSGDMDDLGDGFAEMRGQLALPVQGSMRIGESRREGAPGWSSTDAQAARPGCCRRQSGLSPATTAPTA